MEKLISFTRKLILYIWLGFTIIVALLLVCRILNPCEKGISNYDLKDYGIITLIFLLIYYALKLIVSRKDRNETK
jgi:hypothetical protein